MSNIINETITWENIIAAFAGKLSVTKPVIPVVNPPPNPNPVKIQTHYSVVNTSTLADADIVNYMDAVKAQCDNEGATAWGFSFDYTMQTHKSKTTPTQGVSILLITDTSEGQGILGYHTTDEFGQPLIKIFASEITSFGVHPATTISHEILESIADPTANQTIKGRDPAGKACLYFVEIGDPVESDSYNKGAIPVSDFARPEWFEIKSGNQFDQMNKTTQAFQIAQGGYMEISYDNGVNWTEIQAQRASITLNVDRDQTGRPQFGPARFKSIHRAK